MQAEVRQLATEAAFFHAANGHPRIGRGIAVDEHATGFQTRGNVFRQRDIGGPDAAGQAKFAVIGQFDRMLDVPRADQRGHGAKQLFDKRCHARLNIAQHRRLVIVAGAGNLVPTEQQAGAFAQGFLDLCVQFIAQVVTCHGSDVGVFSQRIADFQRFDCGEEFLGEDVKHAFFNDDALGRDANLTAVLETSDRCRLDRFINVGIGQHDERIGTAQFEDAFLQRRTGLSRDGRTRAHASSDRDRCNARVGNSHGNAFRGDVDHFKHTFWQTGLLPGVTQLIGATHDVRRVFKHVSVTREQDRDRAAQHLPQREVPRHHRQDRTQRQIRDVGFVVLDHRLFWLQHRRAMLGVPFAQTCTFLDLGPALGNWLAHFQCSHARHRFQIGAQGSGHFDQHRSTIGDRGGAPDVETFGGSGQGLFQFGGLFKRILRQGFARGRVQRDGVLGGGGTSHVQHLLVSFRCPSPMVVLRRRAVEGRCRLR